MEKSTATKIAELRKEYLRHTLSEESAAADPFVQFDKWFQEAIDAEVSHPDAMTLATTTAEGSPDVRTVLLKDMSGNTLRFYTNYLSAKGRQLEINYSATVLFFWPDLERQVRVKGKIARVPEAESDAYFATRPIGAQLAASISPQSEVVPNREWLEQELVRISERLTGQSVPRPAHWGGYALTPHEFEFWQGRENRLHDRLRYRRVGDGWTVVRLAP